ncbi:MAG: AAA family ATPase [Christensenellaceae bacterium]|nr:AAA family ATPase [Christensenellaceae bacterium]
MKIAIIGYSGAGKSTLAKRISEKFDIPLLYLDTIRFKPHWTERADEECIEIIGDWMDEHECWVIDGNYKQLLQERRYDEADYIVFLDFPKRVCWKRVKQRFKEYEGRSRESVTFGCEEKLDDEFIRWVKHDCRDKYKRAAYDRTERAYPEKFIRCKNDADVDAFVEKLHI